jgi:hypothetical protein
MASYDAVSNILQTLEGGDLYDMRGQMSGVEVWPLFSVPCQLDLRYYVCLGLTIAPCSAQLELFFPSMPCNRSLFSST